MSSESGSAQADLQRLQVSGRMSNIKRKAIADAASKRICLSNNNGNLIANHSPAAAVTTTQTSLLAASTILPHYTWKWIICRISVNLCPYLCLIFVPRCISLDFRFTALIVTLTRNNYVCVHGSFLGYGISEEWCTTCARSRWWLSLWGYAVINHMKPYLSLKSKQQIMAISAKRTFLGTIHYLPTSIGLSSNSADAYCTECNITYCISRHFLK